MDISIDRIIPVEEAFRIVRFVPLEAAQDKKILFYQDAKFQLADFPPTSLNPISLYLLEKNLDFQRKLRNFLLDRYGIDTLALTHIIHLKTATGIVGLIPPYVEISEELVRIIPKEGDRRSLAEQIIKVPLLIDGIHRAWLAKELGLHIRCIVASELDSKYPCGAYPASWSQVSIYQEVPAVKKFYRRQEAYSFMRPLDAFRLINTEKKEYGR